MKLSVITINYNNCEGLRKTIESVVNQTWRDFEYVVIDGGSTDGSVEVIKEYADRIDYWVSEPDKGIYNALNKGVAVAKGEYCNFMNSGDCFYAPDTLQKLFAQQPTADIVCGNTFLTNGELKKAQTEISMTWLFANSICHQSAFIRTTLMQQYGYDERYRIVADRKFFVQALVQANCSYEAVDVAVVSYDVTGLSAQNPERSRLEYARMLEELIPERIRVDYAKQQRGALHQDTAYDRLFAELRNRRYARIVYRFTHLFLRMCSLFKPSARFVKSFPKSMTED